MNADRWVERYIAWLEFTMMKHFVQLFVSSQFKLSLHQLCAEHLEIASDGCCNCKLEEEVYMEQPKGFVTKGQEHQYFGLQAETKYLWLEAVFEMLECCA